MAAITGFDLCGKLCDLFGIEKDNVSGIDISVHCGEIVRVVVTRVGANAEADGILRTFTSYELHPSPPTK